MRINDNIKGELLDLLRNRHIGAESFITSNEIEQTFGIKGTVVRQIINKLRCEGQPICSSTDGYFYAQSITEVELTASQLLGRIKKIINAVDGLILSQQNFHDGTEE